MLMSTKKNNFTWAANHFDFGIHVYILWVDIAKKFKG